MNVIPLFVVYNEKTKETFEQCFSEEAAKYYASNRNCSVGVVYINEAELEVE